MLQREQKQNRDMSKPSSLICLEFRAKPEVSQPKHATYTSGDTWTHNTVSINTPKHVSEEAVVQLIRCLHGRKFPKYT